MDIKYPLICLIGKIIIFLSRLFNIGNGGTWPGEIALRIDSDILGTLSKKVRRGIILVAGTNGKTTTTLLINQILSQKGLKIVYNDSGANLINGIVSSFIKSSDWKGNIDADWGIFEVDENSLPAAISNFQFPISNKNKKLIITLLNLFRDQLDRYGEVDVIAEKWARTLSKLDSNTTLILNADDPQIAYLAINSHAKIKFFGLNDTNSYRRSIEHATDSIYCLKCGGKLTYTGIYYSHIGDWYCSNCGNIRPKLDLSEYEYPLPGLYNRYNILASVLTARTIGINEKVINEAVLVFKPAFGRQEEMDINGKRVKIFLSKNPAGFNESLRTIISLGASQILFILNDRIPDGRDVSWIWDVDFDELPKFITPVVSGDRAYDLALRLKYARGVCELSKDAVSEPETPILIYEKLPEAIKFSLQLNKKETLYILSTYSAMLEVRKILSGKKIL